MSKLDSKLDIQTPHDKLDSKSKAVQGKPTQSQLV